MVTCRSRDRGREAPAAVQASAAGQNRRRCRPTAADPVAHGMHRPLARSPSHCTVHNSRPFFLEPVDVLQSQDHRSQMFIVGLKSDVCRHHLRPDADRRCAARPTMPSARSIPTMSLSGGSSCASIRSSAPGNTIKPVMCENSSMKDECPSGDLGGKNLGHMQEPRRTLWACFGQ